MRKKALVMVFVLSLLGACQPPAQRTNPAAENQAETASQSVRSQLAAVPDHRRVPITIGPAQLEVEVVNTPQSITQGLSDRPQLGADGMLFILRSGQVPSFWMKDMQFNLDMIWISEGRVIAITEDVPAPEPSTALSDLPTYSPEEPADMVLEVVAGQAEALGIKVGDQISI